MRIGLSLAISATAMIFLFQNCSKISLSSVPVSDAAKENPCIDQTNCDDDGNKKNGFDNNPFADNPGDNERDPLPPISDDPNDPPPIDPGYTISTAPNYELAEDGGSLTIPFTSSSPLPEATSFRVEFQGNATSGEDYVALPSSFVVAQGKTDFQLIVTAIDDNLWDVSDEHLHLRISYGTAMAVTTVTLKDDEPFPDISLKNGVNANYQAGITHNSLVLSIPPDQDIGITLRTDKDVTEADEDYCNIGSAQHIVHPTVHYVPLMETELNVMAEGYESTQFQLTWLQAATQLTTGASVCHRLVGIRAL